MLEQSNVIDRITRAINVIEDIATISNVEMYVAQLIKGKTKKFN